MWSASQRKCERAHNVFYDLPILHTPHTICSAYNGPFSIQYVCVCALSICQRIYSIKCIEFRGAQTSKRAQKNTFPSFDPNVTKSAACLIAYLPFFYSLVTFFLCCCACVDRDSPDSAPANIVRFNVHICQTPKASPSTKCDE